MFYVIRPDAFDVKHLEVNISGNIPAFVIINNVEVDDPGEANVMAPSTFDTDMFWRVFFEKIL